MSRMSRGEIYGIAAESFALAFGVLQQMIEEIPPFLGWAVVIGCVITGIVLITRGRQGRNVKQKDELRALLETAHLEGKLENISEGDAYLIIAMAIELESKHGWNDLTGLLADRASGVPLNKLKANPCSQCGIPRNKKGRHGE